MQLWVTAIYLFFNLKILVKNINSEMSLIVPHFTNLVYGSSMVSNCLIKGTPPSSGPPLTDEGYVRGERGGGGQTTGGETRSWLTNLPT